MMEHELTAAGRNDIDRLSYEIALKRQLDFDGRKEVAGHIEDKVLGYLNGDEALTEDDALLLAREHFGSAPVTLESRDSVGEVSFLHTLLAGILPYGIGLLAVTLTLTVFHAVRIAVMLGLNSYGIYVLSFAISLLVVVFVSARLEKPIRNWSQSISTGQLKMANYIVLFLIAFFVISKIRFATVLGIQGTSPLTGEGLGLFGLSREVLLVTMFMGYLLLTLRFLIMCDEGFSLKRSAVALGFWFTWHWAAFTAHMLVAAAFIWGKNSDILSYYYVGAESEWAMNAFFLPYHVIVFNEHIVLAGITAIVGRFVWDRTRKEHNNLTPEVQTSQ